VRILEGRGFSKFKSPSINLYYSFHNLEEKQSSPPKSLGSVWSLEGRGREGFGGWEI